MATPILSDAETPPSAASDSAPRRRSRFVWALWVWFGFLGLVGLWCWRVLLSTNQHVVIPGIAYRGAQLSPAQMEQLIRERNIRTVVNLRGPCHGSDWYEEQTAVCQEHDVAMEDLQFSATRSPSARELRRLVEIIERSEKPLYFHCQRGADRTGMASALAALLLTDEPWEKGRGQLGLWAGHLSIANTRWLDLFLDEYPGWLKETNQAHSRDNFKHWVSEVYPKTGWWRFEETSFAFLDEPKVGATLGMKIRLKNTSRRTWKFDSLPEAGLHLGWHLWDGEGNPIDGGKAAFFRRDVEPGGEIDITLAIPGDSFAKPGKHRLFLDLIEEGNCWFFQAGADPLLKEFDVRD